MCQVAVLASWLEIIRKIGWTVGMEDFLGEKVPDRGHDRNGLGEKIFMRRLGDKPFCLSLASESHGAIGWVVPNGPREEKWTDAFFGQALPLLSLPARAEFVNLKQGYVSRTSPSDQSQLTIHWI